MYSVLFITVDADTIMIFPWLTNVMGNEEPRK